LDWLIWELVGLECAQLGGLQSRNKLIPDKKTAQGGFWVSDDCVAPPESMIALLSTVKASGVDDEGG
jgi:hypothetical protein